MNEKEKMLNGKLYLATDETLVLGRKRAKKLTNEFNTTEDGKRCKEILKELFGEISKNVYIEPPFRCDYGYNISIGENFYANYDCIILDVNKIKIGNNVMFGPRVSIYSAGHPIDSDVRNSGLEFGLPVEIGDNVWIGGNSIVNPNVKIGNNVVIGSGSVVTKNIPDNTIAVGNPCRVLREINDDDKKYWCNLI